jgi:predicted O-methyltransferase YrrM
LLKRRNLEPATASLLALLIRAARARRVVEVGTANGYSMLWLADAAADVDGRVVSIDALAQDAARANLARADAVVPGLAARVDFRQQDGGEYLASLPDSTVDLLFLDAERTEYPGWWPHPVRVTRPGGIIAIDNVLSHPDEVASFLTLLAREPGVQGTTIAVGKGLHLAWRSGGAG